MSVVLGLPKKLLPSPEASLSEGCTAQWVKIQPNNVASITSNNFSGLAISTISSQIPMVSQEVRFSIPCGQGKNVWLDTSKTSLSFRAKYTVTVASVANTTTNAYLQGSAINFFDRLQVINSNGVPIDDVVGLSQIETHKQIWSFDAAERDSVALSHGFRFEKDSTDSINALQGHFIPAFSSDAAVIAAGSNLFSYDMPLPSSFLGSGAKGFVPIGALQKLDCYLTTNATLPITISVGSGTGFTSATLNVTLDNFAINAYYVTLDDKSAALLGNPRMHYVHGITNRASNATINSGVTGQISTLIGIRGQSVRSLATRFSSNDYTTAGCANGVYDSKMPLVSQMDYFLQGRDRVPPNPHSTQTAPATVFLHALQASEAFNAKDFKYGGTPAAFCTYMETSAAPTAAGGYDQNVISAGSATGAGSLAAFCFAEDLRKCSTSQILDGYNMASSANNYLELNVLKGPSNNVYATFIASMDIIYLIDMETGAVEFRV